MRLGGDQGWESPDFSSPLWQPDNWPLAVIEPVWSSQGDREDWELYLVALDATSIFLIRDMR